MATIINLNGIHELDLTLPGTTTATVSNGVVSVVNTGGGGGSYSLGGTLTSANISLGAGAGAGATLNSIAGLDGNHQIEITTGTSPAVGSVVFTVTFTASRGHVTYPIVQPANYAVGYSGLNQIPYPVAFSATSYTVFASTALTASTFYAFLVSCP